MKIIYGYKWFRAMKRLTETWDENRARSCHENRQLYVAVVEKDASPSCFVEIKNDYIGVGFLDGSLREYLSYQFQEIESGRMFLTMATRRKFEDGSDKVKSGTTYFFKQDGNVTIKSEDFLANTRSVKETQADVSGNWEPYPVFGQYHSIIRENRQNSSGSLIE
jgi:hypothetical protein